jgi:hypothetical protein
MSGSGATAQDDAADEGESIKGEPADRRFKRIELPIAALLLTALVVTQLYLVGTPKESLGSDLWYDEIVAWTLATDPDPERVMRAIRTGFDVSPPTLTWLQRTAIAWFGQSIATLRGLALTSLMLAVLALFVIARRVVGPVAAFAAALVPWATDLGVRHGFELRFYGPLLAATAWTAVFLPSVFDPVASHRRTASRIAFAVTAMLTCGLHYFGIIGWTLLVLPSLWVHRRRLLWPLGWRESVGRWLALAAGPVVLVLFLPTMYEQSARRGTATWIKPLMLDEVLPYLLSAWTLVPMIAVLAATAISLKEPRWPLRLSPAMRGVGWLMLVPVFLVFYTFLTQPVVELRYAIVMLIAMSLMAALLLRLAGTVGRWTALVLICVLSTLQLQRDDTIRRERIQKHELQTGLLGFACPELGVRMIYVRHKEALEASYYLHDAESGHYWENPATRTDVLDPVPLRYGAFDDAQRAVNEWHSQRAFEAVYGDQPGGPQFVPPPGPTETFYLHDQGILRYEVAFPFHERVARGPGYLKFAPKPPELIEAP